MKINLLIESKDFLKGYLNIDPFPQLEQPQVYEGDVSNIDKYVDNGEAEEIRAFHILSYFEANRVDDILLHWISKLALDGVLTLVDIDLREISRKLYNAEFDISAANDIIYGKQEKQWQYRKSALSLGDIAQLLTNKGLLVIEKALQGGSYMIKAKRVKNGNSTKV
jgi:hypothetical protein